MTPDPRLTWMKDGPSLEQRMSGLIWFGNIYEAKNWDPSDPKKVDVLQRANTPLLQRATPVDQQRNQRLEDPLPLTTDHNVANVTRTLGKTNLLIMTDYVTYSPHEATQGAIRPEEEYFVQFWQHVDVFCYFVHRHIAIPPATWINAGHRNGAQVIGALMFEGNDGLDPQTAAMFEADGGYWLSDKLAEMASYYGFDGWLINVEVELTAPDNKTWAEGEAAKAMDGFIARLKQKLVEKGVPNGGKVIWYDSLVRENLISYQDTLNEANLEFAQKAGSIITNYPPKPDDNRCKAAGNLAVDHGLTRDNIYMGRIIFTDTANAKWLEPMAKYGLGSGLFATGWCFQKFKAPPPNPPTAPTLDMKTYRSDADRYMWTGDPGLGPDRADLAELKKNGVFGESWTDKEPYNVIDRYIHPGTQTEKCITKHAKMFPAGSDSFFHTNYGTAVDYRGPQTYAAHLNEQSVWPSHRSAVLKTTTATGKINTKLVGPRGPCAISVEINTEITPDATQADGIIYLHNVNMRADLNLNLTVKYKRSTEAPADLKIFAFAVANSQHPQVELTGSSDTFTTQSLPLSTVHDPITAIGIHLQGPMSLFKAAQKYHVLDVFEMTVQPQQENYSTCNVRSIELVQDSGYSRLNWTVSPLLEAWQRPAHLPYSSVTGPFSCFDVAVGTTYLGRAFTLAFVLDQDAAKKLSITAGTNVEIVIRAIAFDGTKYGPFKQNVTWQ